MNDEGAGRGRGSGGGERTLAGGGAREWGWGRGMRGGDEGWWRRGEGWGGSTGASGSLEQCYTEKATPAGHRLERQHNARSNRRKQCSPNKTKPYSNPTPPRKRNSLEECTDDGVAAQDH